MSNHRRTLDSKPSSSKDANDLTSKNNIWEMEKMCTCKCDDGYDGYDCSERICTSGDDPLTSGGEQEMQLFNCFSSLISPATLPSTNIIFSLGDIASTPIPVTATPISVQNAMKSIGHVHVQYSYGDTLCSQDSNINIVRIAFLDLFGPLPALSAQVYDDEEFVTSVTTVEVGAYDSTIAIMNDYRTGVMYQSIKGSKENDICNQHGICERSTGICQCFESNEYKFISSNGYHEEGSRGDCGLLATSSSLPMANLTSCPNNCNSHGVCDPISKRCNCQHGFTGYDCSLRSCPYGYSWVNGIDWVECSLMGSCDVSSGNCICRPNYFGASCEYINCEINSRDNIPCNGHGACLTSRTRDLIQNFPVARSSQYFWHNLKKGLDDRVFYCDCDVGYHGYDCSLRSCAQGNDPLDENVDVEYDCSNHGVCDKTTGLCSCFRGWGGGSNGINELTSTTSNKCGHRLPIHYLRRN